MNYQGESVQAGEVRRRIEALAPLYLAASWDNSGWQIGSDQASISGILLAIDVNHAVVAEAQQVGANLIVAHHPLFFRGLKQINPQAYHGRLVRDLLLAEVQVYAAHTNLDAVREGVNGALADALGLSASTPLEIIADAPEGWGWGAVCESSPVSTREMAGRVAEVLHARYSRVTPAVSGTTTHTRIGLMGGSGASMIGEVIGAGCSLYITGEVKYHEAQEAAQAGLTLIEAGHYESERPVLDTLREWLAPLGIPVWISRVNTSPFLQDWKDIQP